MSNLHVSLDYSFAGNIICIAHDHTFASSSNKMDLDWKANSNELIMYIQPVPTFSSTTVSLDLSIIYEDSNPSPHHVTKINNPSSSMHQRNVNLESDVENALRNFLILFVLELCKLLYRSHLIMTGNKHLGLSYQLITILQLELQCE